MISGTKVQVKRGAPLRIVATLKKIDADMDDINNFPLEVREWKDSIGMGDSVIIEFFDWDDPAAVLDTNANLNSLDFFYNDSTELNPFNIEVEIVEPGPAESDLNPDNISFTPLNTGGAASYGLDGIVLIDESFNTGTMKSDEVNLLNSSGLISSLTPGFLSFNLGSNPRATLHVKQQESPALALENDGDGDDTYIFDIMSNDLHVLYDADGPGNGSVPTKITELDNITGAWENNSDLRLKKQIMPIGPVLKHVMKLQPKTYLYNYQDSSEPPLVGFIAQDVRQLFPNLVDRSEDGFHTLNYHDFGVLAIKAIQEQQHIIDAYQEDLKQLKEQVTQLASLILQK